MATTHGAPISLLPPELTAWLSKGGGGVRAPAATIPVSCAGSVDGDAVGGAGLGGGSGYGWGVCVGGGGGRIITETYFFSLQGTFFSASSSF
jgi:hypothetical protein